MDALGHHVRVAALPPGLPDQQARSVAAAMVSALGVPYFSISGGHGLRLRGRPDPARDPVSFVGFAVRTEPAGNGSPLDYLALSMLRPASPRTRCSTASDLRAAASLMEALGLMGTPEFFDARVEHLHGAGTPDTPFSTLGGGAMADGGWLRWSGKKPFTGRDDEHRVMLEGFAELLEVSTLSHGELLIAEHTERLRPPHVSR